MSVGERIRSAREAAGLTQAYVAEQAGVTQAMLCQIERGTKNPSLQTGAEIARVLKCSLENLLHDGKEGNKLEPDERDCAKEWR